MNIYVTIIQNEEDTYKFSYKDIHIYSLPRRKKNLVFDSITTIYNLQL